MGLLRAPRTRQVTSRVCEDMKGTEGCWGQGRLQSGREDPRCLTLPVFVIAFVVGGSCLYKTAAPNPLASLCMCPSPLPMASLWDHGPLLSLRSHRMVVTHVKDEAGPRDKPAPLGAINIARPTCSLRKIHPLFQRLYIHALIEHLLCTSSYTMC